MKRTLYESFVETHCDRLVWRLSANRLRILAYHGVCEDRLAGEPWVPKYLVTRSAFESQMAYLKKHARVVSLREAIPLLRNGRLDGPCVSITFDDGYANNLHLAYPLLRQYRLPATIFLTTKYVEDGDVFPFHRLSLIRLAGYSAAGSVKVLGEGLLDYKRNPLDLVLERAERSWQEVKSRLSKDQYETLRPLRIGELNQFDSGLVDFGAHSHTHCILGNESEFRRERELSVSLELVSQWLGRPARLFSYPNGESGDFNARDKKVLRSRGVEAAVSMLPGSNRPGCDLLELKRYGVGLYHYHAAFVAEVTGFSTALRSLKRSE
jgi:peptidoglycan/xylan/chitin deacetylase (PgdA/CDA1 family)